MAGQEVQKPSSAKPRIFYGYVVVVAAFIIMVVVFGVHYAFGVFFKPILTEFGWTRAMTSGAFSLSWILQGSLAIVMGRLNDKFGSQGVLTVCGFLIGLGYLLMSQVSAAWHLYLLYGVIIGAGLSGVYVPLLSTVARWFVKRRNMMTGIVISGVGIGMLIGPLVANWLISTYDWRTSYIILGSLVLVVVVLAAQSLRRDPTKMGQRPYGESSGGGQGLKLEPEGFSLKEAVHTRQFWLVFAMFFCFGFYLFSVMVHIVPHATDLGISAATAANILAAMGGVSIIGNVVLGGAADRIGNRQVCAIGFILMSASLFWLVPATEVWTLYLFAVVFGFALSGCTTSESPLVARLFGLRSHGLIFGVINIGFAIGATIGPIMAGYIFDVIGSYQSAFLVFAALGIVALVLTILLTPIKGKHSQNDIPSTI